MTNEGSASDQEGVTKLISPWAGRTHAHLAEFSTGATYSFHRRG